MSAFDAIESKRISRDHDKDAHNLGQYVMHFESIDLHVNYATERSTSYFTPPPPPTPTPQTPPHPPTPKTTNKNHESHCASPMDDAHLLKIHVSYRKATSKWKD